MKCTQNEGTDDEVRKEITSLLRDEGFEVKDPGVVLQPGNGDNPVTPGVERPKKPRIKPSPLPTLPYPKVTRFEIVFPEDLLLAPLKRSRMVRIETDANYRFDRENRVSIRSEPPKVEIAATSLLDGGRKYWRMRPSGDAKPGDDGEIIASLTKPDGSQLESRILFEIAEAPKSSESKIKGLVPSFHIIKVDPHEQFDLFEKLWPDVPVEDVNDVAYRSIKSPDGIIVYYSTAFRPYREQVERIKQKKGLAELFRRNYEIWIGYHAILQVQGTSELSSFADVEQEKVDVIQEKERALVAVMQSKQALKTAEIQRESAATKAQV